MKSFDTKSGKTASKELAQTPVDVENSVKPTEITDAETAIQESQATAPVEDETEVARSASSEEAVGADQPSANEDDDSDFSEDLVSLDVGGGGRFHWPGREQLVAWAPFAIVILVGILLRFWDLGAKPLHHDESLHAYFSLGLLHNLQNWGWCVGLNNPPANYTCYTYDPLLHGPFQFHAIALVYQISQWLGAPDNGVNTTTVRLVAAILGSALLFLPYYLRDYLGKLGAWLTTFLLAVSPSMVYFSRFAREDIYVAAFTLLLVVGIARYMRSRKISWLLIATAGFTLSYATAEVTFLTIAIFGSFLGALIVWEIGTKFKLSSERELPSFLPRTFAPFAVLLYFAIVGIAAKLFFAALENMASYIIANPSISDAKLVDLETTTLRIIPWLGILLGLYVFSILAREVYGKIPPPGRRGLARLVDRRQPVLDTILTMPWTHWFFAIILGWVIFLVFFTVMFTNLGGGIGDGIWRGLYYWLQQQNVARGGQPWYYYLLLIPLYEQIGVVFALVGIVRCIARPSPFRLFLVYWFVGSFFIYSWAGEKMPWLMIFMTMPMLILAAVGLEPCIQVCYHFVKERFFSASAQVQVEQVSEETEPVSIAAAQTQTEQVEEDAEEPEIQDLEPVRALRNRWSVSPGRAALGLFGIVMAVLLLLPTLHNMYEVTYVQPADGPYEMMVYVQTT
ncbi:MAG TPA: flippase activity-associated protein Agl23, partial [Ktedonobacteraceae bacterium]|nr:flippase activity-associated protein Agl23 [Ktedonobacteraceae bacterium]